MAEVVCHDGSRAAVEGEGRSHHAPVADGEQLLLATLAALDEQLDRVAAVGGGMPLCERGTGRAFAQGFAQYDTRRGRLQVGGRQEII